ncbi:MAG: SLBB domain-containing protein [bacterium]
MRTLVFKYSAIISLLLAYSLGSQPTVIQPGTILKITVANHPEFSQSVIVRQDGTTEYPLLSGVPLEGLTVRDLKGLLISALLQYERDPVVFVVISETQIIKVDVYGAVNQPQRLQAEAPLNIQQVIQMVGGPLPDADLTQVRVIRYNSPVRQEEIVDLSNYYLSDTLRLAPEVHNGDVIIVPRAAPHTMVRVIGEVNAPGSYLFKPGEDLFDLINRAGGFKPSANSKRIRVIHSSGKWESYNFVNLTKKGAEFPSIVAGDVVVVPPKEDWTKFSYWATLVYHLSLLTSSIVVLSRL